MYSPQNLVSDRTPLVSLLRILLNVLLGFIIVGPLLGLAVASAFYDGDLLADVQHLTGQEGFTEALLLMQGIVTLIGLIVFPLIYITQLERKPLNAFFPSQPQIVLILLAVALLGLAFPITISPLAEWNANLKFPEFLSGFERWATQEEERLGKLTAAITDFKSLGQMLFGLVVIALLPAIGEELVFRGMIQHELWRGTAKIHLAIWISAIIFSAIHMQFYGFLPRLLLGALFGYLYYWSGNLAVPIFAHFVNNAFGVVMMYLHNIEATSIDVESVDAAPLQLVVPALLVTIGLLYYIWKYFQDNPPRPFESSNLQEPLA